MARRPAGKETDSLILEYFLHCLCVLEDLFCVNLEFRRKRLPEANSFCCDIVHQRSALEARKYCLINLFTDLFVFAREYHPATRSTKRFVRGRGDDNLPFFEGLRSSF